MSNRPCILHVRRYRAVYEGLLNSLRDSHALQPKQLAHLKELQHGICSCAEDPMCPGSEAGERGSTVPVVERVNSSQPGCLTGLEHAPGWRLALERVQAQLLHLAHRQGGKAAEAVMEPAIQRLEFVVAQAAAISEQERVRRQEARREAREAVDWMYAVATPVVKRRGGARRGGPFSRAVAGRLTIACLGRSDPESAVRSKQLPLALAARCNNAGCAQVQRGSSLAAPLHVSASVLDLSEFLELKLQLWRGTKHGRQQQQQSAWRKRQGGRVAAAEDQASADAGSGAVGAAGTAADADAGINVGQVVPNGTGGFAYEPMDIADGMRSMSLADCGATASAAAAGAAAGMLGACTWPARPQQITETR